MDRTCQISRRFEASSVPISNYYREFSQHVVAVFQATSCCNCDKGIFQFHLLEQNVARPFDPHGDRHKSTLHRYVAIHTWLPLFHGSQPTHSIVGMYPNTRSSIDRFFSSSKVALRRSKNNGHSSPVIVREQSLLHLRVLAQGDLLSRPLAAFCRSTKPHPYEGPLHIVGLGLFVFVK